MPIDVLNNFTVDLIDPDTNSQRALCKTTWKPATAKTYHDSNIAATKNQHRPKAAPKWLRNGPWSPLGDILALVALFVSLSWPSVEPLGHSWEPLGPS